MHISQHKKVPFSSFMRNHPPLLRAIWPAWSSWRLWHAKAVRLYPCCRYPSDDINKFLWMVRIGGGVFPDIKEKDYLGEGGYRVDDKGGKVGRGVPPNNPISKNQVLPLRMHLPPCMRGNTHLLLGKH